MFVVVLVLLWRPALDEAEGRLRRHHPGDRRAPERGRVPASGRRRKDARNGGGQGRRARRRGRARHRRPEHRAQARRPHPQQRPGARAARVGLRYVLRRPRHPGRHRRRRAAAGRRRRPAGLLAGHGRAADRARTASINWSTRSARASSRPPCTRWRPCWTVVARTSAGRSTSSPSWSTGSSRWSRSCAPTCALLATNLEAVRRNAPDLLEATDDGRITLNKLADRGEKLEKLLDGGTTLMRESDDVPDVQRSRLPQGARPVGDPGRRPLRQPNGPARHAAGDRSTSRGRCLPSWRTATAGSRDTSTWRPGTTTPAPTARSTAR